LFPGVLRWRGNKTSRSVGRRLVHHSKTRNVTTLLVDTSRLVGALHYLALLLIIIIIIIIIIFL